MAWWYVNSAATGTNAGTSWPNACTSLSQLLALGTPPAAGDSIAIANTSAESYSSATTLTFPGTIANPNFIYSVDTTDSPPASSDLLAGASVTTTGANALTLAGSFYCYGVTFNCGSGANNSALSVGTTTDSWIFLDSCALAKKGTTGTSGAITFGPSSTPTFGCRFVLNNTTMQFGSTSDGIGARNGFLYWRNTASAIVGATVPSSLFGTAQASLEIFLEGVDLSALGSGNSIAATGFLGLLYLKDCKLGSSVTVAGTPTNPGPETYNIRSDSGATNYRNEKYSYYGTETTNTSITRVGGATDGATAQSRKYATTANSKWVAPFLALPITVWNTVVGQSVTVTLYGTWNSGSVPNNDQIWFDAEYLGNSSYPLGSLATATKANNLASGTALTSDGSTWNGGGSGSGWSPFSMSVTFTPQMAGPITLYVKVADPSSTFYVDPQPIVSP